MPTPCGELVMPELQRYLVQPLHQQTHAQSPSGDRPFDLSVWCFDCNAYLDVQVIRQLQPVYEVAYLLKFGERPPLRGIDGSYPSSADN
ncbi:hypothetical protein KSP40_PGU012961 [Platanthera guangdongensis]|uniref:Uncharacterized protein n=1 Tax=Platanthera guangdongensis TaxID=2320717 RepID=A0ABR2MFD4_9ASPA